jgi:hypothetical protein
MHFPEFETSPLKPLHLSAFVCRWMQKEQSLCWILGHQSGNYEGYVFLGSDAMWLRERPVFRSKTLHLSSGCKNKPS